MIGYDRNDTIYRCLCPPGPQRASAPLLPACLVPRHRPGAAPLRPTRLVAEVRVQRVGPEVCLRHARHVDRQRRSR